MRFLITDLGTEDLILGYPWLAVFEPKFQWRDASIDVEYLPIIIQSLMSRHPAPSTYQRLTHKLWALYGLALGLSDW